MHTEEFLERFEDECRRISASTPTSSPPPRAVTHVMAKVRGWVRQTLLTDTQPLDQLEELVQLLPRATAAETSRDGGPGGGAFVVVVNGEGRFALAKAVTAGDSGPHSELKQYTAWLSLSGVIHAVAQRAKIKPTFEKAKAAFEDVSFRGAPRTEARKLLEDYFENGGDMPPSKKRVQRK